MSNGFRIKLDPFYFKRDSYKLFGIVHLASNSSYKGVAAIFCNPFAEEKMNSHRVLFNYANILAEIGIISVRFDYWGTGDSSGNFEDADFTTRVLDINRACILCREKYSIDKIILIGLRMGANLALKAKECNLCVAWAPIFDPYQYLYDLLRINLSTQASTYKKILKNRNKLIEEMKNGELVSVDGYLLKWDLFDEASKLSLSDLIPKSNDVSVILLDIVRNIKRPTKQLIKFYDECRKDNNITLNIVTEDPFWNSGISRYITKPRDLFDITTKWILTKIS